MPTTPSTGRRLRRYTAGAALILFPALLVPQAVIDPASGGTGEVMYTAATEHRGALLASALLLLVSGILMVPAMTGILHQARDRGAGLANAGGVLGVLGGFGHFGIALFYIVSLALPGGNRAEMVAYIERLNSSPALGAVAFPLILCFGLGVLVLPWAAWRAGLIQLWGPALASAAVLVHFGLPTEPPTPVSVVLLIALTVVFGHLGLRIMRMTDAEWDGVHVAGAAPVPVPA